MFGGWGGGGCFSLKVFLKAGVSERLLWSTDAIWAEGRNTSAALRCDHVCPDLTPLQAFARSGAIFGGLVARKELNGGQGIKICRTKREPVNEDTV